MRQTVTTIEIQTRGVGLFEITAAVCGWAEGLGLETGLVTLFCKHTSASLLIQENADRDVQTDLLAFFARLAPERDGLYVHDTEGPDDMPAHLRTALTQVQLSVPIVAGRLALGTW